MQNSKSASFLSKASPSAYTGTATGLQDVAESELAKARALTERAKAETDPDRQRALIEEARQAALTARSLSEKVKRLVK